jgi:hypothetical protein
MAFFVGQKVVCIIPTNNWFGTKPLKVPPEVEKGKVYTVNEVTISRGISCLGFEGLHCLYRQDGFRPVVDRKTDISIFTAMLKNKKRMIDA